MILISSCLVGVNCRYNGKNSFNNKVQEIFLNNQSICLCPETLGGLSTPRKPCEIINSNGNLLVLTKDKNDCTKEYFKGANLILKICLELNVSIAILKSKSPACGLGKIFDGSHTNKLIDGNGILANLLLENNIAIYDERLLNFTQYIKR